MGYYSAGWVLSDFFPKISSDKRVCFTLLPLVTTRASSLLCSRMNFLFKVCNFGRVGLLQLFHVVNERVLNGFLQVLEVLEERGELLNRKLIKIFRRWPRCWIDTGIFTNIYFCLLIHVDPGSSRTTPWKGSMKSQYSYKISAPFFIGSNFHSTAKTKNSSPWRGGNIL